MFIGNAIAIGQRRGGGGIGQWLAANASKFLFFGETSKITGGRLYNQKLGAVDYLTVAGSAGSETYQAPNVDDSYVDADAHGATDYIWFKTDETPRTTTTAELIAYDFARTIVKYDNVSPYTIRWIAILADGVTLTTAEENAMRDDFDLSIWWSNVLSAHGNVKGNRGSGQSVWTPEAVGDADYLALIARMTAAGETPTGARATIINTAILALKAAGLWTKLDGLWLMAAHGIESSCLNWISSSYNLSRINTPTFNVDLGFTGNGLTMYLKTGINPRSGGFKYVQDSAMFSVYSRETDPRMAAMLASVQTNGVTTLYQRYTDNKSYFKINGGVELNVANTDGSGLYTIIRDSSTTVKYYKDKTKTDCNSTSDALPPEIPLFAANDSGVFTATASINGASLFALGEKLSPTEQGLFYDILVDGYLQSVGAKI